MGLSATAIKQLNKITAATRKHNLGYLLDRPQEFMVGVADLAAGADIDGQILWRATGPGTVSEVYIISTGASAGVYTNNTAAIAVNNRTAGTVIASKTFDQVNHVFPDDDTAALTIGNGTFSQNDVLELDVTNGAAADLPEFYVQIVYKLAANP